MSFEDTFYCNHCCFTFIIEDIKFHINEDEKLEEYILIMLKEGLGKDSKTSGFVYGTYCGSCGKNIKTYLIKQDGKINCPFCGDEQPISFHEENCPKCGNRLEVSSIIFD